MGGDGGLVVQKIVGNPPRGQLLLVFPLVISAVYKGHLGCIQQTSFKGVSPLFRDNTHKYI